MKLKNKICLITGSGRGIGREIAIEFANNGAIVFINDINEQDAINTYNLIKNNNGNCYYFIADISNYEQVKSLFHYVYENSGRIDVLVNNAAILRDKTVHNMDIKYHWEDVIKVNLSGVFYCCREAVINMRENKYGRIINMTSVIGICGNFGQSAYSASKAGVIGLTKSLAHEVALKNITVNAIAPGFIDTEMIKDIPPEVKDNILNKIPMKKFGKPLDIAKLALFLASDDSSYITGQVFGVNGGFLMP